MIFLNPERWPSVAIMLAIATTCQLLHVLSIVNLLSLTGVTLQASLLVAISIKVKAYLDERIERHKIFDKGNVPSVPNKNPISGNLFEVIVPHHNLQVIESYHEKLGKTYGMFYGPDPWVFTTDLDLLYRVFVKENIIDITQFRMPFVNEMNNSLSQQQGDTWRQLRRTIDPSFTPRQMKSDNVFEDIDKVCSQILECISAYEQQGAQGRVVDVLQVFKKFSVEVIFRVAYGRGNSVNMEPHGREPLIDAIHEGSKMIRGPFVWAAIMIDSLQHFLGAFAPLTPLGRCIRLIHSVLDDSMRQRRMLINSCKSEARARKMIDSIIESSKINKMGDDCIKANLFFIFLAGFETTANTLAIMFWLLAKDQSRQEKLRRSMLSGAGEQAEYLDWCIRETLRLYPAVPTAIGRILDRTIEHEGQTFFPGTTINASIFSIHRCKDYWGADTDNFRPERFGELGQLHPAQYFAFGIGPRYCLGMNLALAELRAIIPKLLLKYRVQACQTTPDQLDITSPNLIHMIIEGKIEVSFVELISGV